MADPALMTREDIGELYFRSLPYPPYPVQEEALLAWFTAEHGVLMCAPTGTGKTLVAHGALFEALHRRQHAYYTTPLIALTEQKFHELQEAAVQWGFSADDVGLVTGNRRVNPDAPILVVVAEILLNRLLNQAAFPMDQTAAVVMDEFHSFNDPERGIVWELSLGLIPAHIRLMLLSATVGNAAEFIVWLQRSHQRKLELVRGTERKVPLTFEWVNHQLLSEQLVAMCQGAPEERKTPALVFCFNREECWNVGEQLKGLDLLGPEQRQGLHEELERQAWDRGVGPKLRQMLWRGVGVHHAGLLPRYRRLVEKLFLNKCLPVVLCTETLSAGLNLPCRSVVLTELLKGPMGNKRLINPSIAHQIFGRAGRPQFDDRGFVFAMAHEDDVKIARWEEKFKSLPENPKDPGMIQAKKNLLRKKPTRRTNVQYWTEAQFQKLMAAAPSHLASHGPVPWRLLAYYIKVAPDVAKLREFIKRRLLDADRAAKAERSLVKMLSTLHRAGFVILDPPPPDPNADDPPPTPKAPPPEPKRGLFDRAGQSTLGPDKKDQTPPRPEPILYFPQSIVPQPTIDRLLGFRSIHPLFGVFLLEHLPLADDNEKLLALEGVLTLPKPLLRYARPPLPEEMPPGPLEREVLDPQLVERGLIISTLKDPLGVDDEDEFDEEDDDERPPSFSDKLRLLFQAHYPEVNDLETQTVWAAGEILRFGGDFDKFVRTMKIVKQEGIIFRHLLRLILLCGEFAAQTPTTGDLAAWRESWSSIARRLTLACRDVDPVSTARTLKHSHDQDFVASEPAAQSAKVDESWNDHWDALLNELLPAEKADDNEDAP